METETGGRNAPPGYKPTQDVAKNAQQGAVAAAQRQNDDKPELRDDSCSVFISNLAYTLEDPEPKLKALFESCGPIRQVRLVTSNRGNFKGYGYVQFESVVSVAEALKMDRKELEGRPMFVSPCVDKNKNPEFKVSRYQFLHTLMHKKCFHISFVYFNQFYPCHIELITSEKTSDSNTFLKVKLFPPILYTFFYLLNIKTVET